MEKNFSEFYDRMMVYVDYDGWAKLIRDRIMQYNQAENLLEIGCGTGEILSRLKRDFKVTGIDKSEEMIITAKQKFNDIELCVMDMLKLKEEKKYDAVVSNFDTLNYLKDLEELSMAFNNISQSLKNNGIFLFDVLNRKMMDYMFPEGIFADDREDMTIIWKHKYNKEAGLDEIITSFFIKEKEKNYTRYDEKFVKKIFTHNEILKIADSTGFQFVSKEINTEIAGPRIIYIFKRVM